MKIRRTVFVLAALALGLIPSVAAASPVDHVGPAADAASDAIPGPSGQHLVCYAPGFTDWVVCVDYP